MLPFGGVNGVEYRVILINVCGVTSLGLNWGVEGLNGDFSKISILFNLVY
jgi:hypothetical protein